LAKRGFAIAPLQSEWVQQKLEAQPADLLQDLRLLLVDGGQVRGADVYRYVMRRIWWAYPFYVLSVTPLFRRLSRLNFFPSWQSRGSKSPYTTIPGL